MALCFYHYRFELTPPKGTSATMTSTTQEFLRSEETINNLRRKSPLELTDSVAKRFKFELPPPEEEMNLKDYSDYYREKLPWREKLNVETPAEYVFKEIKVA